MGVLLWSARRVAADQLLQRAQKVLDVFFETRRLGLNEVLTHKTKKRRHHGRPDRLDITIAEGRRQEVFHKVGNQNANAPVKLHEVLAELRVAMGMTHKLDPQRDDAAAAANLAQ